MLTQSGPIMLRFCMITTFYPPYSFGGDGVFVQALSRGLASQGHSVDVIHCVDSYRALGGSDRVPEPPEPAGVTVHRLKSPFGILSPLATHQFGYPLLKSAEILRILDANAFDVIHFHNASLVGGPGVLHYGKALKLYTTHEHWLLCPMHTLFRNNREACAERHCISCALHYRRPPQWWRYGNLLEEAVQQVDTFITPTEFTRELHLSSGLPMKIRVLGNFHEPARAVEATAPARPFFLYAGRLEKLKGVNELVEAFRSYTHADLLIAGDGTEGPNLRQLAGGSSHIRFLGKIAPEELAGLYRAAIGLVVPSITYEVFPLVLLEAFAAGTPVIARDLGPLAEIVNASGGGLLFKNNDELLIRLRELQSSAALRDYLGQQGHNAWRERWTLDAHLRQYLGLIAELQGRRWSAA